jgi:hypothetical protein
MSAYVNITYDDPFRYCWNEVPAEEWFLFGSVRQCTEEQLAELKTLEVAFVRMQTLLKEMTKLPEVEGSPACVTHVSCAFCGECMDCNLRPCRDPGVPHRASTEDRKEEKI